MRGPSLRINLKGPWGVIFLLCCAGGPWWWSHTLHARVETPEFRQQLLVWVKGEYLREYADRALAAHRAGNPVPGRPPRVEIGKVEMRGVFARRQVFRVEVIVNGNRPPGDEGVRYFMAGYSVFFGGWTAFMESGELAWTMGWL